MKAAEPWTATIDVVTKEMIMNTHENSEELIDLGAASVETRGTPLPGIDFLVAGRPVEMSDED